MHGQKTAETTVRYFRLKTEIETVDSLAKMLRPIKIVETTVRYFI